MSAAVAAVPAAFRFPARTGAAQHDGLALLRHVITHGVTPASADDVALALHVAPLAFLGAPETWTVAAVNRAVDQLAAAQRRLTAEQRAIEAEKAARLRKLAALFDGEDETPLDGGTRVPVDDPPPAPPSPAVVQFEGLVAQLVAKTGITEDAARQLLLKQIRQRQQGAAQEVA